MKNKILATMCCFGLGLGTMQGCGGVGFLGLQDYQRDLISILLPFALDLLGLGSPDPVPGEMGPMGPEGPAGNNGAPGRSGRPGSDGTQWHQGQGEPTDTIGAVGDFFIDTETNDYYYRDEGGWVLLGNLQGSPGNDGTDGQNGTDGENGQNGFSGQAGRDGEDGDDGQSCWDLNGNGLPDCFSDCCYEERQVARFIAGSEVINEDVNCDGVVDVLDCQGSEGEQGETGEQGPQGPVGPQGPQGDPGPLVFDQFIDDFFTTNNGSLSDIELGNKVSIVEPSLGECGDSVDVIGYRFGLPQMYETDNLITMRLFVWRTGPNTGSCFTTRLDIFGARHGGGGRHLGTRFVTLDNPMVADPNGTLIVLDLPINNPGNDPSRGLCLPPNFRPGDFLAFVLTETDRVSGGCYTVVGAEFYESIGLLGGNGVVHATVAKTDEDIVCEPFTDCDLNNRHDPAEIANNPDLDCNTNGVLDVCENLEDCNENNTPDACEEFDDCNENQVPDECELCRINAPKIPLCHVPEGNTENDQQLYLPGAAVRAHLAQHEFDFIGLCESREPTTNTCVRVPVCLDEETERVCIRDLDEAFEDGATFGPCHCLVDDNDDNVPDECEELPDCFMDVDCDDQDECTDDVCEEGSCVNTPNDCEEENVNDNGSE